MIPALLNTLVSVKRRADSSTAPRDALNNPVYGSPTDSWTIVYASMPARLAFTQKEIQFSPMGERVLPTGVMYYGRDYHIKAEDRIVTDDGIEYVILGVVPAFLLGGIVDHYEAQVALP